MYKPKFNVGDKVRCIKNDDSFYKRANHFMTRAGIQIGNVYEVQSLESNGTGILGDFIRFSNISYCHPVDCFELIDVKSLDFKNTFGVKGNPYLIEAFKQAALEEGWKLQGPNKCINPDLYFCSTGTYALKKNHFWYCTAETNVYNLPEQWNEAIACMKERVTIEVENPIYIAGYKAEINGGKVAFGCQSYTLQDIQSYIKLYNKQVKGHIQINGEPVTLEQLNQLEKMLTK